MSRPDDPIARGTPATHRGRRPDQHFPNAASQRPGPAPEQWHANEPYHFPGQERGDPSQMFAEPAPVRPTASQHDPRSNRPRQPGQPQPEYAPQFARYSGVSDQHRASSYSQPPRVPPPEPYAPPRAQHYAPDEAEGQYWARQGEHFDGHGQTRSGPQRAYDAPYQAPHDADRGLSMAAREYDQHGGYHDDRHEPLRADHEPEGEEYEEEFEDEEPPRRRGLIYAAAFLSCIAIGAGAAVGYKLLFSDKGSLNAKPISTISSPKTPTKGPAPETKTTLAEPKKEAVRPSDTMTAPTPTEPTAVQPAPRVPGLIVQRPPAPPVKEEPAVTTSEAPPTQPTTKMVKTVPITKDGVPVVPPIEPPQQKPVEVVTSKTVAQKNIDIAEQTAPVPPARVQAPQKPAPQKTQVAVATQPQQDTDATEVPIKKRQSIPKAPVAPNETAPKTTASTAGFVAVLSSQKSRGDALRAFADLQQKYPAVLSDKQPEVQGADLNSGHWERLIVGPPASRESAKDVCDKLAAAGYKGCWVKAY